MLYNNANNSDILGDSQPSQLQTTLLVSEFTIYKRRQRLCLVVSLFTASMISFIVGFGLSSRIYTTSCDGSL